jgi:glutamate/tyrosine decarboxylase-like PLP-dependent enzyme
MDNKRVLNKVNEKIDYYLDENTKSEIPVVLYKTLADLKAIIPFKIEEEGVSEDSFLTCVDLFLKYSIRTGNPQFLNQLYSGFNFPAYIGDLLTALTNTSMYTYEVAPVATAIEIEMIQLMNSYSGFKEGDGIFVTGGSNANLIALFTARNQINPDTRNNGISSHVKLRAFISENAHYSFETAANLIGIGSNSVIKVKATIDGSMCCKSLEKAIEESLGRDETPFFVGATCGTTMLGAYDNLDDIAVICKKYNLWLHADGSFGGSIILSKSHNTKMKGIAKADSFAWNPHKLMNIPLICSVLLVRKKGVLEKNITDINTDYIYHDFANSVDLGKKSIQCGRRVDAVKLWFAWKYFGIKGYERRIDNIINLAKYAEEFISNHKNYELLSIRQSFSVCFRIIPEFACDINEYNLEIREFLRKSGNTIVNYGYLGDKLALRLVTSNGEMTKGDIDSFFHKIDLAALSMNKK